MSSSSQPLESKMDMDVSLPQSATHLPQHETQLAGESHPQPQLAVEPFPKQTLQSLPRSEPQHTVESLTQTPIAAESIHQPQISIESLPQPQVSIEPPSLPEISIESLPQPQLPDASEGTIASQNQAQPRSHAISSTVTTDPSASSSKPNRIPDCLMHKNRLQQYTQRSGIQLPLYNTVNEGLQHAPRFRATVVVDGITYESSNTFLHRKEAEQDAAKTAFQTISRQIKDGNCLPTHEVSTVLCKLVLNEFSAKMNLQKPVYSTVHLKGPMPLFASSVSFNCSTYTGVAGKNKKEAEQLAARKAIESLLGNIDSRMVLCEIIKSKAKLYAAMDQIKDAHYADNKISTMIENVTNGGDDLSGKGKAVVTGGATEKHALNVGVAEFSSSTFLPQHIFEKPNQRSSSEDVNLPITFVQATGGNDASSSGKRKRKNKKKPNKKPRTVDPLVTHAVLPLNQAPPCPVSQ